MKKTILYLIYGLSIIAIVFLSVRVIQSWKALKNRTKEVTELEKQLKEKNTECCKLKKEIHNLKSNPHTVEKKLRERFKYADKDDIVITYPERKDKKNIKNVEE